MREEYKGREISVDAIHPLLDRLPTDITEPFLSKDRISWASFSGLLDRYAAMPDADPKALGAAAVSSATYKYRRRIRTAGHLLTLGDLFRFILYPRNPIDFSCINTAISAEEGRVDVLAHINRSYEPNETLWEVMLGAGEELLRCIGHDDTELSMSVFPHEAHFAFTFEHRADLPGRFRSWSSRLINAVVLRAIVLKSYPDLVAGRKLYEDEAIERARIATELAAAQRAFETRLAHIDEVVAEFDPAGRVVYVSPNLERVLGLSEDASAEDFFSLVHAEDIDRIRSVATAALIGQHKAPIVEFRIAQQPDEVRWIEVELTRYAVADGQEHTIATGRDISERRKDAEERRALDRHVEQTQRLEMLGVLAGGIAHDFNNLLVPILGQAELAALKLDPESELHQRVETIRTAAEKASDLVAQLILYAGGQPSKVARVDLAEETAEMLKLASASFKPNVQVQTDLAPGTMVNADSAQLRQIIMNLLINAAEAIGDNPGLIEVAVGRAVDGVMLKVRDNGCGMDEETRQRVFEPFFTTKFTGRGLGLSAVLGIVRAHQGELLLESHPGEGTCFELHLPAAPGLGEQAPEPGQAQAAMQFEGTALLVDDEAAARDTGKDLLEQFGFDVAVRCDGAEALAFLAESRCDVAIVDLVMPKVDGREVLAAIRRDTPEMPVIMVSGYGIWSKFKADAHTRFLAKPYRANDLAILLAELNLSAEALPAEP